FFDLAEDAKARPFRPLPSGRVSTRTAALLGVALVLGGLALAVLAGLPGSDDWNPEPLVFAGTLAALVLLYDAWLKHLPIGPVAMASCRFTNVMMGLAAVPESAL